MKEIIEVSGNPYGSGLQIKTSFGSAMGVAIDILQFLDKQQHISVKNTG
jgi:hypothetical protein